MPHSVILPGAGVVRVGGERLLVPKLRILGAAKLAARKADQVGDVGMVVAAERAQRDDRARIILPPVDQVVGVPVAVEEQLLRLFLRRFLLAFGCRFLLDAGSLGLPRGI